MTARPPLTPQQAHVLNAIRAAITDGGVPPTLREIGARVGLTPSSVLVHVRALEAAGHIRRPASAARAIPHTLQLCDDSRPAPVALPRLDRVIAVLRIDVPDTPAAPTCAHPRTGTNRWYVAGIVLCRTCGRAAVADHLARRTAVEAR